MQVNETKEYLRTKKKLKNQIILQKLNKTVEQLKEDHCFSKLEFKTIICKRDKFRHSIRVLGTDCRVLMSVIQEDICDLVCVCDHDKYNRLNKDC